MTILQSFGIKILISRFLDMTILFNDFSEKVDMSLVSQLARGL